jgi:hypothetical protein
VYWLSLSALGFISLIYGGMGFFGSEGLVNQAWMRPAIEHGYLFTVGGFIFFIVFGVIYAKGRKKPSK